MTIEESSRRGETARLPHPAKFSKPVLKVINEFMIMHLCRPTKILDPFAGVGTLMRFFDESKYQSCAEWTFTGIEIEPEWASQHPSVMHGNALHLRFADNYFDMIITSPAFGNRMADHHEAKDDSKRTTYRHYLRRELSPENSGGMQWGPQYREFHKKAWAEVTRVLAPGGELLLNIKNHIRGGHEANVVEWHVGTLIMLGYRLTGMKVVDSAGNRFGQNGQARVDYEYVLRFEKIGWKYG